MPELSSQECETSPQEKINEPSLEQLQKSIEGLEATLKMIADGQLPLELQSTIETALQSVRYQIQNHTSKRETVTFDAPTAYIDPDKLKSSVFELSGKIEEYKGVLQTTETHGLSRAEATKREAEIMTAVQRAILDAQNHTRNDRFHLAISGEQGTLTHQGENYFYQIEFHGDGIGTESISYLTQEGREIILQFAFKEQIAPELANSPEGKVAIYTILETIRQRGPGANNKNSIRGPISSNEGGFQYEYIQRGRPNKAHGVERIYEVSDEGQRDLFTSSIDVIEVPENVTS